MPEQDIHSNQTDDLSAFARDVLRMNLAEAYRRLVVNGGGSEPAKKLLSAASAKQMLAGAVRNEADAEAMLAGLWLWHDWLDESHHISQSLHSATGSFWPGI